MLPVTDMIDYINKGSDNEEEVNVALQEELDDLGINGYVVKVPQSTDEVEAIDQLQLCQAVKNLGLYALPEGSPEPKISTERQSGRVDYEYEERPPYPHVQCG